MEKKSICSHCGSANGKFRREGEVLRPFMDWSFKYLFGTPENKPNLIGFLNLMLMPQSPIVDVEYMNNESQPDSPETKSASLTSSAIVLQTTFYRIE